MNPLTYIEKHAICGFDSFSSSMFEIWKAYKRYGEIVLEKDLEEGDEKFKPIFTQSKDDDSLFFENVKKYWQENYHFVVSSYEELFKIFLEHRQRENAAIYLELLPETGDYRVEEIKGWNKMYSVQKDFYDKVSDDINASKGKNLIIVNHNKEKIFFIKISDYCEENTYRSLIITEQLTSDVIIV